MLPRVAILGRRLNNWIYPFFPLDALDMSNYSAPTVINRWGMTMSLPRILEIHFDEVPLVDGRAGLIECQATVNVWSTSDWSIAGISLYEYGEGKSRTYPITITEHPQIYCALLDQLENGDFAKQIETQIERDVMEAA